MKKKASLLLALAIVFAASAAVAQDYARPGLYAQGNFVIALENFDNVPSSAVDSGFGVSGRVGYRLAPMFAVEGQFEYSGDFSDISGLDLTGKLVTFNGKVYFLQEELQPYALAGLGGGWADFDPGSDEDAFVVKVGGGVDFYFSESWGVNGEVVYNIGTGDLDDFNYTGIALGAFLRF
jgi:opacity protein-like surface antigen